MIDDFLPVSGERRKPKIIQPLEKPSYRPLPNLANDEAQSSEASTPFSPPASNSTTPVETTEIAPSAAATADTGDTDNKTADTLVPKPAKWLQRFWPLTKKQQIIAGVLAVLLAFGLGGLWAHFRHTTKPAAAIPVHKTFKKLVPHPTTVPSTLSGLPVSPEVNQRPVTAVMIENSPDARPQSGLKDASVVFEALAEGGVTRFMALYQDTAPTNVGPIRSARPYYIQWAMGFDAAYSHVGGSPDALNDIKSWNVKDLNQFYNGGSYHRVSSRAAPHNVYTGIPTLNQLEVSKGYNTSNFTGFARKADTPSKQPTASTISLTLSGPYYNVSYSYNSATNSYNRSEGGAPHMDADSNTQLSPKVVIAMVVPETRGALDASGAYYSDYNPIGSGQVFVFQDGTVTSGTWSKPDMNTQLSFSDAAGKTIKLNAGQTWLTVLTAANEVSYK